MTPTAVRKLLFVVIVATLSIPRPTRAQSATRAADAPEAMSAQEREIQGAADQLAAEATQVLEQWVISQATTEDKLFSRMYYPVAKTDPHKAGPQQYTTPYTALADRDLAGPEDKAFAKVSPLYAIVTDINGYVPVHNTRFAQPLSGNSEQDYINNRSKRLLSDSASQTAAHSEARVLIQRFRLETGDVIYDLSVPVMVRGKHWGCVRIGYRRME